jgi:hypothetical protein
MLGLLNSKIGKVRYGRSVVKDAFFANALPDDVFKYASNFSALSLSNKCGVANKLPRPELFGTYGLFGIMFF